VSVNGNEEPRWRDLSPIQFSSNCNYSLITHNKTPVHTTWGLLRVCAACPTVRLNLSSELRPSGYNIQDTFPTCSTQDKTYVHGVLLWPDDGCFTAETCCLKFDKIFFVKLFIIRVVFLDGNKYHCIITHNGMVRIKIIFLDVSMWELCACDSQIFLVWLSLIL
jgi:hypothetical protein